MIQQLRLKVTSVEVSEPTPEYVGGFRHQFYRLARTELELTGPDGTELKMTLPRADTRWLNICRDAEWLTLSVDVKAKEEMGT